MIERYVCQCVCVCVNEIEGQNEGESSRGTDKTQLADTT